MRVRCDCSRCLFRCRRFPPAFGVPIRLPVSRVRLLLCSPGKRCMPGLCPRVRRPASLRPPSEQAPGDDPAPQHRPPRRHAGASAGPIRSENGPARPCVSEYRICPPHVTCQLPRSLSAAASSARASAISAGSASVNCRGLLAPPGAGTYPAASDHPPPCRLGAFGALPASGARSH